MRMLSTIGLLTVGLLSLLFSGCQQPKPLYTYGDYSGSYYASKKDVNEDSSFQLQMSIENAIENAHNSSSGRVAPGMYANLGYIHLKGGNTAKAIENFNKEKTIYPEATHFMNRMIQKIKVTQGDNK